MRCVTSLSYMSLLGENQFRRVLCTVTWKTQPKSRSESSCFDAARRHFATGSHTLRTTPLNCQLDWWWFCWVKSVVWWLPLRVELRRLASDHGDVCSLANTQACVRRCSERFNSIKRWSMLWVNFEKKLVDLTLKACFEQLRSIVKWEYARTLYCENQHPFLEIIEYPRIGVNKVDM